MIKSNKKVDAAIEAFEKQKRSLKNVNANNYPVWASGVNDLIKKYLGEDSAKIPVLNGLFTFTYHSSNEFDDMVKKVLPKAESLLDSCIEYVKEHGLYTTPKQGLSEGWLIFWAGTAIVLFLTFTPLICDYGKDKAALEWKDEKKELYRKIDSLNTVIRSTPPPDSISK